MPEIQEIDDDEAQRVIEEETQRKAKEEKEHAKVINVFKNQICCMGRINCEFSFSKASNS